MLALVARRPGLPRRVAASTFIYRVTHNAALTWKRAAARLPASARYVRGVPARRDGWNRSRPGDGPADRLELLYTAIRALEPIDRSLVLLQLDGVSYADIAAIHGITDSNVGVRLNRIKQKLTAIIQEKTS